MGKYSLFEEPLWESNCNRCCKSCKATPLDCKLHCVNTFDENICIDCKHTI